MRRGSACCSHLSCCLKETITDERRSRQPPMNTVRSPSVRRRCTDRCPPLPAREASVQDEILWKWLQKKGITVYSVVFWGLLTGCVRLLLQGERKPLKTGHHKRTGSTEDMNLLPIMHLSTDNSHYKHKHSRSKYHKECFCRLRAAIFFFCFIPFKAHRKFVLITFFTQKTDGSDYIRSVQLDRSGTVGLL